MTDDPTHTTPASPSADGAATVLALLRGADDRVALLEPASGDRVTYGALRDAVNRIGRELEHAELTGVQAPTLRMVPALSDLLAVTAARDARA